MKLLKSFFLICLFGMTLLLTGCRRNTHTIWEDTQTAGRHIGRGVKSLAGIHCDSRQIQSRDEFMCGEGVNNPSANQEFVALADDPNLSDIAMADRIVQPRETPGDPGSSIPGIEAFQDPSTNPRLSGIFRHIHFAYNSTLIKGENNLVVVRDVADYMRKNPHVYVFIEGHCDERGPEAYNLVLGANRSNSVRNLLIKEGINADNIFTISYGKERPIAFGHEEETWTQNRRAEFKVYQR